MASLGLAAFPAEAARVGQSGAKPAKDTVATVAAQDPETTSSVQTSGNKDANCASARQRMFVEGEGWIVRRVTTCY